MERLTIRRNDGRWAIKNDDNATPLEQMNKIPRVIERLAAYEDTGLDPEEVTAMKNAIMGQEIAKITEFRGDILRAQQPPLDRSRWEGCWSCNDPKVRNLGLRHGREYCPRCGKPLTEEAWAELERMINGGTTDNKT